MHLTVLVIWKNMEFSTTAAEQHNLYHIMFKIEISLILVRVLISYEPDSGYIYLISD